MFFHLNMHCFLLLELEFSSGRVYIQRDKPLNLKDVS